MIPEENSTIINFQTLWLKCKADSTSRHQLFFKEHSVRNQEPELPRGRTLFVLNVPPYATVPSIEAAFSRHCGHVKLVKLVSSLGHKKSGFKVAYVVFSKESQLHKALSLPKDFTLILSTEDSPCIFGVQKWCKQYNASILQSEKSLKESIEKYIKGYDRKCEEKLNVKQDDDGWVTITSRKKRGQFAPTRKESVIERSHEVEERKNKKKQLLNFYTFQMRESKKQHLVELRKKFELDKEKLRQLKTNRTFKPFG